MYWCDDMKVTKQYGFIGVTLVERKKLRLYVLKTFVLTVVRTWCVVSQK